MKNSYKFIAASLLFIGLNLGGLTGCVGGYVATGGGVYYGGDPWIRNDVVIEGGGRGWYGGDHRGGAYVHPSSHGGDHNHR